MNEQALSRIDILDKLNEIHSVLCCAYKLQIESLETEYELRNEAKDKGYEIDFGAHCIFHFGLDSLKVLENQIEKAKEIA